MTLNYNPDVILFTDVCSPGFGRYAGTYRIASELRDNGFIVQVVEYFTRWTTEELRSIVRKFVTKDTLWVGVSSTFLSPDVHRNRSDIMSMPVSITGRSDWSEIVGYIRDINPRCKIAIGGAKSNMVSENDRDWDHIMLGQGEVQAVKLSVSLSEGRSVGRALTDAYDDYPTSTIKFEDNDIIHPGEHLPVEIARGCIFKCSFCNYPLNGKKLWEFNRKPELVREDIQDSYNKFGSTGFMFCDDNYNDSPDKVIRFHKEFMKLDHKIEFSSYARLDLIVSNWDTAKLLYESGLRSVFFGVESLNHKSAKTIGKGMDPERIKDGLYRLKEECPDMVICTGMIVGLPYDTHETLTKNNEWFLRDDCPVDAVTYSPLHISPTSPLRNNSKMSNDPDKYGYDVDESGYWIRNDGYTKQNAVDLTEEFLLQLSGRDQMDKFGRVGAWTFFNRLQNIGYTIDDFKHDRLNMSDVIVKENKLMNDYKLRLINL